MKKFLLFLFSLPFFSSGFFAQQSAIDSLEKILSLAKEDTAKVNILNNLAMEYIYVENDKALKFSEQALELAKKIDYYMGEALCYRRIAIVNFYRGDYTKTFENFNLALKIYESLNDTANTSTSYSNIGGVHLSQGNYTLALENLLKALRIAESISPISPSYDKINIAKCYNNIGLIYYNLKNLSLSLEFHQKSLDIKEKLYDKVGMAASYQNIGMIYDDEQKDSLALENYNKALEIFKAMNMSNGEAQILVNIGNIFKNDKKNKLGLDYFLKALELFEKNEDASGIAASYIDIADCYFNMEKYDIANMYFQKARKIAYEIDDKEKKAMVLKGLSMVNSKLKNFENALEYLQQHANLKDTILNEKSSEQIAEMQTKYDTEKKDAEIKLLNKDKEIAEADKKKQRIILYAVIFGLILVIVFSVFVYRSYKQKQIANIQLEKKNTEINHQKKEIEVKNSEILASIRYAKRIQKAVLKDEQKITSHLPDHFVLFKPKDIVSGDFYWATEKKEWWLVAAADCTGHGVPGAFLTMLGTSYLNEIVSSDNFFSPAEILNKLCHKVVKELSGTDGETKDGMDISLFALNLQTNELQWAGANNSLYIIRNKNSQSDDNADYKLFIQEIKADKQPIGFHPEPFPFTNHKFQLQKGDSIYIFSDGYADQFGGPKGKKFKYSQLEKLLVSLHKKPTEEQKEILNNENENWRKNLEQVDDICVIGIKI